MAHSRLHMICGNCGCNNMFSYEIVKDAKDFGDYVEEGVYIHCENCSTPHSLDDNAKMRKKKR